MLAAQLAARARDVTGCCKRNRTGGPSAPRTHRHRRSVIDDVIDSPPTTPNANKFITVTSVNRSALSRTTHTHRVEGRRGMEEGNGGSLTHPPTRYTPSHALSQDGLRLSPRRARRGGGRQRPVQRRTSSARPFVSRSLHGPECTLSLQTAHREDPGAENDTTRQRNEETRENNIKDK